MPEDGVWVWLGVAAFLVGVAKTGFGGIGVIPVAILAELYGKASVGLLLPLLVVADFTVYPLFRKYASWEPVWRLLPPALVGIAAGFFLLDWLPEEWARPAIGGIILAMVSLQILRKFSPEKFAAMAVSRSFGLGAGVAAGVATMLANAAGPVFQLYFLSRRMAKMEMIGVGARFFLLVNLIKLPFLGGLDFINGGTLAIDLRVAPLVLLGVFSGRHLLGLVSQRVFEGMIIGFALLAGLRLVFG